MSYEWLTNEEMNQMATYYLHQKIQSKVDNRERFTVRTEKVDYIFAPGIRDNTVTISFVGNIVAFCSTDIADLMFSDTSNELTVASPGKWFFEIPTREVEEIVDL